MMGRYYFALLLASQVFSVVDGSLCDTGWSRGYITDSSPDTCIKTGGSDQRTFSSAKSRCEEWGAHLMTPQLVARNWLLTEITNGEKYWIGFSRVGTTNTWLSESSGNELKAAKVGFSDGEPSNSGGSENCVHTWQPEGYNDSPCSRSYKYICEKLASCNAGTYLDGENCVSCPIGTYRSSQGGVGIASCSDCPAGTYGDTEGMTNVVCSGQCLAGHYCPSKSTSRTQAKCPPGYYGSSTGLQTNKCDGRCNAGYYCSAGSTSGDATPCDAGHYGIEGATTSACSGLCDAGYYCNAGSDNARQYECGGSDVYCPQGSTFATRTSVSAGQYSTGGTENTRTGVVPCERGFYCTGSGDKNKCPVGTFGDTISLTTPKCSGNCSGGYFCPEGSVTSTVEQCGSGLEEATAAGVYCPSGTTSRRYVQDGYYSIDSGDNVYTRYGELPCESGYRCESGIKISTLSWTTNSCRIIGEMVVEPNEIDRLNEYITPNTVGSVEASTVNDAAVSYSIENDSTNLFSIGESSGDIIYNANFDFEFLPTSSFTVKAQALDSQNVLNTIECDVVVKVQNINESPYWQAQLIMNFEIEENAAVGSTVGEIIEAVDLDSASDLRYYIRNGNTFFSIDACQGIIVIQSTPVYSNDNYGAFQLLIGVKDQYEAFAKDPLNTSEEAFVEVNISIKLVNEPPRFQVNSFSFKVNENEVGGALTSNVDGLNDIPVFEPDGDAITWSLAGIDFLDVDSNSGSLNLKADQSLDFESVQFYSFTVVITDPDGLYNTLIVELKVVNLNDPPVIPLGIVLQASESMSGGTILTPAIEVHDDDGDVLQFSIVSDSWEVNTIDSNTAVFNLKNGGSLNFESVNTYKIALTASDGQGGTAETNVTINVVNENEPPVITAGQNFTLNENVVVGTPLCDITAINNPNCEAATINFDDPEKSDQSFSWSITNTAPSEASGLFSINPATSNIYSAQNIDYELFEGPIELTVRVTDNGSPSMYGEATIQVHVQDMPEKPTITSTTFSVAENANTGEVIGKVDIDDPDNGETFQVKLKSFTDVFQILNNNELAVLDGSKLNYEQLSSFSVAIEVTDKDNLKDSRNVIVFINDVNEKPYFRATSLRNFSICSDIETGEIVGICVAVDPDENSITYSLEDNSQFSVGKHSGHITKSDESISAGTYTYQLTATDGTDGTLSSIIDITIEVKETTCSPKFKDDQNFNVDENPNSGNIIGIVELETFESTGGTLVYSIESSSPSIYRNFFQIVVDSSNDNQATLSFKTDVDPSSSFNYEYMEEAYSTKSSITLSISARFGDVVGYGDVVILIQDINESPSLIPKEFELLENVSNNAEVGTVSGDDPDGDTLRYVITDSTELPFDINESSGVITVSSTSGLDYESFSTSEYHGYHLMITVFDGLSSSALSVTRQFSIKILNVNEALTFNGNSYEFSISESSVVGVTLGTILAIDPDGDDIRYSVKAEQQTAFSNYFNLNDVSGEITLISVLDWEDIDRFEFNIEAKDEDFTASTVVIIIVTDVNDITVSSVTGVDLPTSGSSGSIVIAGTNFGKKRPLSSAPTTITLQYGPTVDLVSKYTAVNCFISSPNMNIEITCDSSVGIGIHHHIKLVVNGIETLLVYSDINDFLISYTPPAVTSVVVASDSSVTMLPTVGDTPVEITGTNLGPVGTKFSSETPLTGGSWVKYKSTETNEEYIAASCEVATAHEKILCSSVPGTGSSLQWKVSLAVQESNDILSLSYAPPAISSVSLAGDIPTTGVLSDPVVITGVNFGVASTINLSVYFRNDLNVRYNARECAIVTAHTQIECNAVDPGYGRNFVWVVVINGQESSLKSTSGKFVPPDITEVTGPGSSDAFTVGGQEVDIVGKNFGPTGSVIPTVYYGNPVGTYIAKSCKILNHDRIRCLTAPGTGYNHKWSVDVGSQTSLTFNAQTNYRAPSVSSFEDDGATQASTRGDETVTIYGSNFGPLSSIAVPLEVTYGLLEDPVEERFYATECSLITAHTVIQCKTSAGAGKNLAWFVKINGQISEDATTNYAPPSLSYVVLADNLEFLSTRGKDTVTLGGTNFGPSDKFDEYVSVHYGVNGLGYEASCTHVSHSELTCVTQAGSGRDLSWIVTVQSQSSPPSTQLTSYADPVITQATPRGPTSGNTLLEFKGSNFGLNDGITATKVKYEGKLNNQLVEYYLSLDSWDTSSNEDVIYVPLPAGEGSVNMIVVVTTRFNTVIESELFNFEYDSPEITHIVTEVVTDNAGIKNIRFDLRGANFGFNPIPFLVLNENDIDGSKTQLDLIDEASITHTSMTFYLPYNDLEQEKAFIYLDVASKESNVVSFESSSPQIVFPVDFVNNISGLNVMQQKFSTSGGTTLRLTVTMIGSGNTITRKITVDGIECDSLTFSPSSTEVDTGELSCEVSPGEGRLHEVVVYRGEVESAPVYYDYEAPMITAVNDNGQSDSIAIATVGGELSITGVSFGRPLENNMVFQLFYLNNLDEYEVKNLTVISRSSHSDIRVQLPPGQGGNHFLRMITADQPSNDFTIHYATPFITSISPDNGPTTGEVITISGSNFGVDPSVYMDETVCSIVADSLSPDHSSIKCNVPAGQGTDKRIIIKTSNLLSSSHTNGGSNNVFNYNPPLIGSVLPSSGYTSGSIEVIISGENFGVWSQGVITHSLLLDHLKSASKDVSVPLESIINIEHETIRFTLPEGQGKFNLVTNIGGQSASTSFSYKPPEIESISPSNGNTEGGYEITITGRSFGSVKPVNGAAAFTARVTVGGKECIVLAQKHQEIRCRSPAGVGREHKVIVTLDEVAPSNSVLFSYDPPDVVCPGCGFQPNVMDSGGGEIVICGENFGSKAPTAQEGPISVDIGGFDCGKVTWSQDSYTCGGEPFISCVTQPSVVGVKNITITVGGQTSFWNTSDAVFATRCRYQSYGQLDEWCLNCDDDSAFGSDEAALCQDVENGLWGDEPIANPGWWQVTLTTDEEKEGVCHPKRLHREECPFFLACEPKSSCLGDNTCAEGYEFLKYYCETKRNQLGTSNVTCTVDSDCTNGNGVCSFETPQYCASCGSDGMCECTSSSRCSLCTSGTHFREGGECVDCPNLGWVIVIGLVLGVLGLILAGIILNSKNLNLSFVSIGIDFFQVLAMFRRSSISWPEELIYIFRLMSIFNFNLDLAAPECIVPNFEFKTKWFLTQALPWGPALVFFLINGVKLFWKRCVKGVTSKEKLFRHTNTMYSLSIMIFYFLFLYMLRNQLDILNCSETDPSDGNMYASFTSPSCGGLCECWEPGTLQMELLPFAVITLCLYSIGFALALFLILRKHRETILEDQYLRASGYEDASRLQLGEVCYRIRKRYSRIYYHFSPEYYYWILVIIGRKTAIALTSLLYRKNPSFQFAVALLVMFTSYVLQVKYQPYMSPSLYSEETKRFNREADDDEHSIYHMIRKNIDMRLHHQRKQNVGLNAVTRLSQTEKVTALLPSRFKINYNTVESRLLQCSVFVCLAGICFENAEEGGPFDAERTFLTWVTILLVSISITYFFVVFLIELGVARQWAWAVKDPTKNNRRYKSDRLDGEDDTDVTLEKNVAILSRIQTSALNFLSVDSKAPTFAPFHGAIETMANKSPFKKAKKNFQEIQYDLDDI